jgi:aminopeptidase N
MSEPVRLSDYTPPAYLVDETRLTFRLAPKAARVRSEIRFRPNPALKGRRDLVLQGEKLRLIEAKISGRALDLAACALTPETLTVPAALIPEGAFVWEAEAETSPEDNTALEGLYISKGMYCTQCEPEGFRRIAYYPDRPDVMAPFRVRIESDLPVLLSNGNLVSSGPGWAEWDDPWPKPSYLFALVAGDLVAHSGRFVTRSGREVALNIWVRKGDEGKCAFALEALIRSMKWDEEAYGREYDLDVFNIVAVDDFNLGAMENKGLNIFNARLVLASPETATDGDYERIEGVIAHEYFHNWTGNRITCRDWFQLCLKEGLTVFRDQEFSADMRMGPVKRIEDVLLLRARQFREDAGPLAHPVRPDAYREINNFYTATVYEKGAEVIGMLKRLVGPEGYREALGLYFERHDGEATTIEAWLKVFEDATGRDLAQFKRWYTEAGTPRLSVREEYESGLYTLHFRQETPPTPGQPEKTPRVIPIAVGLLNPNGDEVVPTRVLEMTQAEQSFVFEGLASRPLPSILRGFSAPVILNRETSAEEQAFLLAHDTDPFNKWEAGRALAKGALYRMIAEGAPPAPAYAEALSRVLRDDTLGAGFRALALRLPSDDDMAQTLFEAGMVPDPAAIRAARMRMLDALAAALEPDLAAAYDAMRVPGPYRPDAEAAGARALRLAALSLLARRDGGARAETLFAEAGNMTEEMGALAALLAMGRGEKELARFYERWKGERLVVDKWFAVQAAEAAPEKAAALTASLSSHPDFDWKNPNRFRALFGALAGNHAGFHEASGTSYRLLADWLIKLDKLNPQTAARLMAAYETWKRYDGDRQGMIRAELSRIAGTPGLSRDLSDLAARLLGSE